MTATPTPTDVIADFLAHSAPDKVDEAARRLVAEDATYISLNFDNPELKQILPWTGTRTGRQAYVDTFQRAFAWWVAEDFEITDLFNAGEDVAIFGALHLPRHHDRQGNPLAVLDPRESTRGADCLLPVPGGHLRVGADVQPERNVDDQERPERPGDRRLTMTVRSAQNQER
jgi:hypothetical protein